MKYSGHYGKEDNIMRYNSNTPENLSIPGMTEAQQLDWLYKNKEALLQAGANIEITRAGNRTIITAVGEGFSPTVSVEEIEGGHRVTITDGSGDHVFDVMDGLDGEDGNSLSCVVTTITGGHRVTISNSDGSPSSQFDVMDGAAGTDGTSITVKSVTPTSGGVNLVITDSAGDHTIFLANGPQGLTGPQGPTGPTGATGATGETGATPIITMTASADGTYSATPTVTVTKGGTDLNPSFALAFSGIRGQQGQQGPAGQDGSDGSDGTDGIDGNSIWNTDAAGTYSEGVYTFYITDLDGRSDVSPAVGDVIIQDKVVTGVVYTVALQITEVGITTVDAVFFANMTGAAGAAGSDGQDGVSPEVTIASIQGGHSVTITDAEHPSGQTFNVMDGENAAAATVTVGSTSTGEPGTNASVTNSGTTSAAVLDFVIPRGADGQDGSDGQDGTDGTDGTSAYCSVSKSGDTATITCTDANGTTTAQISDGATGQTGETGPAGPGVAAGGTAGQVLAKASGTDYDTEWVTPSGGGSDKILTLGWSPYNGSTALSYNIETNSVYNKVKIKIGTEAIVNSRNRYEEQSIYEIDLSGTYMKFQGGTLPTGGKTMQIRMDGMFGATYADASGNVTPLSTLVATGAVLSNITGIVLYYTYSMVGDPTFTIGKYELSIVTSAEDSSRKAVAIIMNFPTATAAAAGPSSEEYLYFV